MREHPDLDQLKRQAKELLKAFTTGLPDAVAEVNAHYRGADAATFALHHAQLVLARAYGFDLVKLLLERGADPVEADAELWATPRAWAEKVGHDAVLTELG